VLFWPIGHGSVQILDEHVELSGLVDFPDVMRQVAEDSLQKEHEADPLVPGVAQLITVLQPPVRKTIIIEIALVVRLLFDPNGVLITT